jgi:hypothetical protein
MNKRLSKFEVTMFEAQDALDNAMSGDPSATPPANLAQAA